MPVVPTSRFRGRFLFTDNIFEVSGQAGLLPATSGLTIGGTAAVAGDQVTVNLLPIAGATVSVTYTVTATDIASGTLAVQQATIAGNLAALINASAAVIGTSPFMATAITGSSNVVTVRSLVADATQNAIRTTASANPGTAGHVTITPTASTTLSGGGAANTTETARPLDGGANKTTQTPTPAAFASEHASNPQFYVPAVSGEFVFNFGNGSSFVSVNAGEPIMLDPLVYAAAIAAGLTFQAQ